MRHETQLVTYAPDGTQPRWLSQHGFVSGITYSYATPGGCDQLTAKFGKPPRWRDDALNPGRLLQAYRGGSLVWSGILDEPTPADDGWTLTAHGAGQFGDDYVAIWTGTWGTGTPDNAVNAAIGRGLNWVNPGIGSPSGMWVGQQVDSGAQSISDFMNLICHKGGLTWTVAASDRGNVLSVYALPTTANRLLVATHPESRSIAGGPNVLYARYQVTADTTKAAATFDITSSTSAADITAHGRREDSMDLSSVGTQTAGAAQGVATQVLKKYQRAAFADPFTVQPGELRNTGGQHVDLGCYWADAVTGPMVCKVLLADYAYGGEVTGGPVTFLVGGYEFDQDTGTATITPFETARHDFASLMAAIVDTLPVRNQPHRKKKKHK